MSTPQIKKSTKAYKEPHKSESSETLETSKPPPKMPSHQPQRVKPRVSPNKISSVSLWWKATCIVLELKE